MRSPKIFFARAAKSASQPATGRRCRNDAADQTVALAQLHRLAGAQPGFQLTGVAKLTHIHRRHESNVSHNVSHRQRPPGAEWQRARGSPPR